MRIFEVEGDSVEEIVSLFMKEKDVYVYWKNQLNYETVNFYNSTSL